MILWRISPFHDLNGKGGLLFSARWHRAGVPVVYLADSAASALLEMCVHTDAEQVPESYSLLKVVGSDVRLENFVTDKLPRNWHGNVTLTQSAGSEWLARGETALFRVPSALVPETWNYLLNPLHPQASQFAIERSYEYPFDLRLKN